MERRRFVARLAAAGAVGATGCLGGDEEEEEEDTVVPDTNQQSQQTEQETSESNETEKKDKKPRLANITTSKLNRNAEGTGVESVSVTGRIRNTAEVEIPYMEARVTFLDSDGNPVGKERAIRSNLGPDSSWDFEVQYPKLGAKAARVTDYNVTVFVDRGKLPDS